MVGSRTTRILLAAGALLLAPPSCTDLTEPTERLPTDGLAAAAAEGQSVVADFEKGQGASSSDQFPGTSGEGWASAWRSAETRANVNRSVINTDPLRGNGNYLSIDQTATADGGVTRITRRYESFESLDVEDDHQLRFDFRLDSADDFSTGNDIIAFFARRSEDRTGAGGTNSSDTWAIRTSGRTRVWGVMDGATEIRTDVQVTTGVVYTFVIEFDIAANTYSVTILVDGEEQFTESGLSYRNDAAEGPGTYIHVHSRASDPGQNLRYSFDSLRITSGGEPGNGNGGSPDPEGIAAEFEGGTGTSSSDQFPGRSGGGWATAWRRAQTRSNVSRSVVNANPLRGNGNYLSIEHAARDTGGVARITRRYESFGDVDIEADHQIRFNFRLDSADDFSAKADIIAFFARRTNPPTGAGGPNGFDTWQIRATGSSGGWLVRDGGSEVTTDVPLTTGVVYTFVIDVDAAANRYAISILVDGTEEFTKGGLTYRDGESTGPGTYVHAHSRVSDAGETVRYSFDSLRITSDGDPGNGNGGTPDPDAIVAGFDGGEGTSSLDQFPGTSGGGWATAWRRAETRANVSRSVIDGNPMLGNGNYLSIDHTATAAAGVTRLTRRYQSFGEVDAQAGHQIEFDFRLDDAGDFNTGNDIIAFFARRGDGNTGAGGPNRTDTWAVLARGSDRVWIVRDGSTEITTDIQVTTGRVYTFAIVTDGTSNRYDVTILVDGTEQFAKRGLHYRNDASDGAGTYLHVQSRVAGSGQHLRYSFDSVRITPHEGPGDGNGNGGTPDPDAIVARFDGGEGTSSLDQFPGTSGGGWATAWRSAETRTNVGHSVVDANPLRGNGNYLSIDHTATAADGATRFTRRYQSFGEVDAQVGHQIEFDFRLDSADDLNTGNDIIAFFARRRDGNTGAGGPNRTDTWAVLARGSDRVWIVRDGSTEITTDIQVTTGRVYTFAIVTDGTSNRYDVTILVDGTEQFAKRGLHYRNDASDGAGTYLHVHSRVSGSGQNLRYSFDSVRITPHEGPGDGNGNGNGNPPNGDRPNEPTGFEVWAEHDFTTLPDGQLSHAGRAVSSLGGNYNIVSEPDASGGSSLRIRFPEGHNDGSSPGRFFVFNNADPSTEMDEWYVSAWVMLEEHPNGGWEVPPNEQKLWYGTSAGGPAGHANRSGTVTLNNGGAVNSFTDAFRMKFSARRCRDCVTTPYQDNQAAAQDKVFKVGQWHHIEFYGSRSTPGEADATFRMWVDGVLVNERHDVQNQHPDGWTTGFREFAWAPIWGGACSGGCPKQRTDYMRLSHLYISGKRR